MVDVVDAADAVIAAVPRPSLRDGTLNFRVVHVLAFDPAGSIVLQRVARSRDAAFTHGSSVAGHVRSGESYAAAAEREFREELGLAPQDLRSLGVAWIDEGARRKFIGVFTAQLRGSPVLDRREVEALEAFTVPELRSALRETPAKFSPTFHRVFRHVDALEGWP